MPAASVATRQPAGPERHVPSIHSVQGINSRIEDIKLRGQKFVAVIGDAIVDATLVRKIVGASELTLTVLDPPPERHLLRSQLLAEAHEITLDGLHWKLVKVSNEGQNTPLTLVYEPLIVYLLKQIMGPHKAFRDLMTRAEYARARAFEARPRPRFIAPELHVVQDIASAKPSAADARKREQKVKEERGKGIGQNPSLKIAGKPATKTQVEILNRMLETGESLGAPSRVMEAMVVACIDESFVGALSPNLMQQEPFTAPGTDHTNPEESAKGFLTGYNSGESGAIGYFKANPGAKVAEICTAIQRNRDGATPYERFLDEGRSWVAAYGGGSDVRTTSTERYAFQQPKNESNWKVMNRLAGEVHWRCFESASWIYFLDEPTLLRSHVRMLVSDSAPGIIDTTFNYDLGKEVTEVTVQALAKTWAAPPGSVATVSRHGPADGLYIVETIESKPSGSKGIAQITLKKPTEPLPEPRPKTTTSSVGFGGAAGSGGYVNPFPSGFTRSRTDMGVDFTNSKANLPVLAIGNCKILKTGAPGWPGGGGVLYELLDGQMAGKVIYVYEGVRATVGVGDNVKAGEVVCRMVGTGYPWLEIGFADHNGGALAASEYTEGKITVAGKEMARFLDSLGAP